MKGDNVSGVVTSPKEGKDRKRTREAETRREGERRHEN